MATAVHETSHSDSHAHGADTAGGQRIQCVVVTPERTVLDERADFVALPLCDGELGVLPGRAPLIGRLGYGELRIRTEGETSRYFIDGGFAQVRDNVVTVLTNRAIPLVDIHPAAVTQELEQANARRATTDFDQAEKAKAVARARAQLRMAAAGPAH
jgi:F-type H+-transporting ATPase subunit epsilon